MRIRSIMKSQSTPAPPSCGCVAGRGSTVHADDALLATCFLDNVVRKRLTPRPRGDLIARDHILLVVAVAATWRPSVGHGEHHDLADSEQLANEFARRRDVLDDLAAKHEIVQRRWRSPRLGHLAGCPPGRRPLEKVCRHGADVVPAKRREARAKASAVWSAVWSAVGSAVSSCSASRERCEHTQSRGRAKAPLWSWRALLLNALDAEEIGASLGDVAGEARPKDGATLDPVQRVHKRRQSAAHVEHRRCSRSVAQQQAVLMLVDAIGAPLSPIL